MIKKLFGYFKSSPAPVEPPKPEPLKLSNTFITFVVSSDMVVDLLANWKPGEEKMFAHLLYSINSGILLEIMLGSIRESCAKTGKTVECEKMITHLNSLFEEERKILSEMMGNSDGSLTNDSGPMVSPSDVFGKNGNSLTEEGMDEEL